MAFGCLGLTLVSDRTGRAPDRAPPTPSSSSRTRGSHFCGATRARTSAGPALKVKMDSRLRGNAQWKMRNNSGVWTTMGVGFEGRAEADSSLSFFGSSAIFPGRARSSASTALISFVHHRSRRPRLHRFLQKCPVSLRSASVRLFIPNRHIFLRVTCLANSSGAYWP